MNTKKKYNHKEIPADASSDAETMDDKKALTDLPSRLTLKGKQDKKFRFDHSALQDKWNKKWNNAKIYHPDSDSAKKPYYNLMMFPYPSAEGLHVGNMYAFTGADVYGRFMRLKGYDVFEPIGLDGFGIHSENYALKIGVNPYDQAKISEKRFYEQLKLIGNGFDWSKTVETYKPDYYKWTQWLFIQLFKAGLAEKKKAEVNWCSSCKTVLADEQVLQRTRSKQVVGVCERCETEVEMKELEQWFFKITKYSDKLLEGLDKIDWTEKVKLAQRNWIGKSEGARIQFTIDNPPAGWAGSQLTKETSVKGQKSNVKGQFIEVFTTRPDTLFGVTFMVLSPEHPLVQKILDENLKSQTSNRQIDEVRNYVEGANKKTDGEREEKEKTGVDSGLFATNPATKEKISIWIADYVIMGYGTGAIMAVPAHDERDFEFAKKYELPIKYVLAKPEGAREETECYTNRGKIIDSGDWTGWDASKDFHKILNWLEDRKIGVSENRYHLRDWLISRQRYWGAPIPMIFCKSCADAGRSWFNNSEEIGNKNKELRIKNNEDEKNNQSSMPGWFSVPEKDLPVILPYVENFKPLGTGVAPLAQDQDFVNTTCPNCHGLAKRETDVCDTFLDSSWYFLRYPSVKSQNSKIPSLDKRSEAGKNQNYDSKVKGKLEIRNSELEIPWNQEITRRWLPVNMYIGGAEHSVLHLLYSRFITKVLYDQKLLEFDEPFTKFRAHGLLIKNGVKMSKSKGNVVNPDEYINKYGADTLRAYLMFLGPYSQGGDFRDSGIEGMGRFLKKVRRFVESNLALGHSTASGQENQSRSESAKFPANSKNEKSISRTIKGVGNDVESLRYNTALAKIMELVNDLTISKDTINRNYLKSLVIMLSPFAPYLTEELWEMLGGVDSVHLQSWPTYDESKLKEEEYNVAVQVNGKLRGLIVIPAKDKNEQEKIESLAQKDQKISSYLNGRSIEKVIYIPGKILNFVAS